MVVLKKSGVIAQLIIINSKNVRGAGGKYSIGPHEEVKTCERHLHVPTQLFDSALHAFQQRDPSYVWSADQTEECHCPVAAPPKQADSHTASSTPKSQHEQEVGSGYEDTGPRFQQSQDVEFAGRMVHVPCIISYEEQTRPLLMGTRATDGALVSFIMMTKDDPIRQIYLQYCPKEILEENDTTIYVTPYSYRVVFAYYKLLGEEESSKK